MAGAESITLTCQNSTVNFQNEKKKNLSSCPFRFYSLIEFNYIVIIAIVEKARFYFSPCVYFRDRSAQGIEPGKFTNLPIFVCLLQEKKLARDPLSKKKPSSRGLF